MKPRHENERICGLSSHLSGIHADTLRQDREHKSCFVDTMANSGAKFEKIPLTLPAVIKDMSGLKESLFHQIDARISLTVSGFYHFAKSRSDFS